MVAEEAKRRLQRARRRRNAHDPDRRTIGLVERMNRTFLDERFRVAGWQTWCIAIDEIQRDLDRFLRCYNFERSHQGYRLNGRTQAQALKDALARDDLPSLELTSTQSDTEAAATAEIAR